MQAISDALRDAIIARAVKDKWTVDDLAQRCQEIDPRHAPRAEHINSYLTMRASMGSPKIAVLLSALGLTVRPIT